MSSENPKRQILRNRMSFKDPPYDDKSKVAMIKRFNKNEKSINQMRRLTTMDTKRLDNLRINKF